MDKAFESQINPLYNNYSKQVDGLITKDQTNDLELYLEGNKISILFVKLTCKI